VSDLFSLRAPDQGAILVTELLEEKAKELGRQIGQSPEYQAVKKSSEALNSDREAVTVLQEMEKIRQDAQRMIQRGEQPTADMEQKLDDLLMKVQSNPAYQRAIAAQENFDKIMYQVNNWIMDGMKKGATSSIITLS
jgi:cell fate (sporulation/competence/biofilm development) regulator YlbF (YheA/YmcA/DUF963 family)